MNETTLKGLVYDIQGFSVHDGPGLRTTVFLKGCPLKCPWCHSPESQSFKPQLSFMDMKCVGTEKCGLCLKDCQSSAIMMGELEWSSIKNEHIQHISIDQSKCQTCTTKDCTTHCYPGALSICGTYYTVNEILDRVKKDMDYYQHSEKGGVTVSGGEPLSQFDFTFSLMKTMKAEGIHTALDTTGYATTEKIMQIMPYVDIFLYDLKHMDNDRHKETVGVPNTLILKNAKILADSGARLQIRMPMIPTINDSDENFENFGKFCCSLGDAVERIQLLPYHRFGDVKYERINSKSPMPAEILPPSEKYVKKRAGELRRLGLQVVIH